LLLDPPPRKHSPEGCRKASKTYKGIYQERDGSPKLMIVPAGKLELLLSKTDSHHTHKNANEQGTMAVGETLPAVR